MRTLKNLTLTLAAVMLTVLASNAAIRGEENFNRSSTSKNTTINKSSKGYTKAIIKNGKIVPVVNLPLVTISAKRSNAKQYTAIKKGGTVRPVVELPEVVIIAEKTAKTFCVQAIAYKGEIIPMVNLPEVVITAERVNGETVGLIKVGESMIPSVNLPEVTVCADMPENKITAAVIYNGKYIPVVNLPVVEISAEKMNDIIAVNNQSDDNNKGEMENVASDVENFRSVMATAHKSVPALGYLLFNKVAKKLLLVLVR